MSETAPSRGFGAMKEFPAAFWLINLIELFERGAYYGTTAVLGYYLVATLGYSPTEAGGLFAILLPLLYIVPIVSSAFSEKYGFKKALVVSFVFLAAGYAFLGFLTQFQGLLLATVLIGIGGGVFKPIAAAMIGQTTKEEDRNLGYYVYYWMINIGAFLTPLVIGFALPEAMYGFALYFAAGLIVLNLVLTLTLFANVRPPQTDKDVWGAVRMLGSVVADKAFLVLLVLYSGFWFMYAINLSFLPLYMDRYVDVPAWFALAFLGAVNPGTIILAGPVLARATARIGSLTLITGGIAVYVVGVLVMGATPTFWVFLGGIVVYSLGEFVIQPSFLSYASKISPPDRVSVYMAYSFVPIALGFFVSPLVTGYLFETVLDGMGRPLLFWAIIASVGLATVAGFLLFNWVMTRPTREALATAPTGAARRAGGLAAAIGAVLLIPALVGASFVVGPPALLAASDDGTEASLAAVTLPVISGTAREGEAVVETVTIPAEARRNVTFLLRWTDEAGPGVVANPPDTFTLRVTPPGAARPVETSGANAQGEEGVLSLVVDGLPDGLAGDYKVEILLDNAGDPSAGPLALPTAPDTGNAFTLEASYEG